MPVEDRNISHSEMVRKKEQGRMQEMLSEAIMVLCKASLEYRAEFSIEGLLGITIDNEEIFLINVNEQIRKAADPAARPDGGAASSIPEESGRHSPKTQSQSASHRKRMNTSPEMPQNNKQAKLDAEPIVIKEEVGDLEERSDTTHASQNDPQPSDALVNNAQFSSLLPDGRLTYVASEESHQLSTGMQDWTFAPQTQGGDSSGMVSPFIESSTVPSVGSDPVAGFQGSTLMSIEGPVTDTYGSHLSLTADTAGDGAIPGCSTWDTQDCLSSQSQSPAVPPEVKGEGPMESSSGAAAQQRRSSCSGERMNSQLLQQNSTYTGSMDIINNSASLENSWSQNGSSPYFDDAMAGQFRNLKQQVSFNQSLQSVTSGTQNWGGMCTPQEKQLAARNSMFKECPICGKKVKGGKFNLTVHVRTHTGDKPHACSICGWRFASPSNIPQHEKTHYTSRHPFHCEPCGLGFPDPALLEFHQRKTHSVDVL